MVFKRSTGTPEATSATDAKFVDELVRKTLDVNPEIRRGRDTQEVLDELRGKAVAKAKTGPAGSLVAAFGGKDPRLQTIDIFLREKGQVFPKLITEFEARITAIRQEMEQARLTTIAEILELVGVLMVSNAPADAVQTILRDHRALFAALKVTEVEILTSAANRKRLGQR